MSFFMRNERFVFDLLPLSCGVLHQTRGGVEYSRAIEFFYPLLQSDRWRCEESNVRTEAWHQPRPLE